MKSSRLLVDINQAVVLTRDDYDRQSSSPYDFDEENAAGIIRAASAAPARIWDRRTAISFGKREYIPEARNRRS
jgi:hypothetical protein